MMNAKIFGQRLSKLLPDTEEKLVQELKMSEHTVHSWCLGKCHPRYSAMIQVCEYVQALPDYLLGITDVNNYEDYVYIGMDINYLARKTVRDYHSVAELSRKSGLSHKIWDNAISKGEITTSTAVKIAKFLNVDINEMFGYYNKESL